MLIGLVLKSILSGLNLEKNKIPISNEEISNLSDKYDVINAHQVLEHIENPNLFLSKIKKD